MTLPIQSLLVEHRELGLVVALAIGFGFGFVLERAGFGRSTKLAAQFYLTDMTVFKVMFGAIVTAMLGVMIAAGVGLVDLKALSESAVSFTYFWPMLVGGLLLGVGFIISGYCPGTSIVGAVSGNIDAIVVFLGVTIGSVLFGELHQALPAVAKFYTSSDMGQFFLYQWLGIPAPVLAVGVVAMAMGAFVGADKVEKIFRKKRQLEEPEFVGPRRPRRLAFSALAGTALLVLATLALPLQPAAAPTHQAQEIGQQQLAQRLLDEPWTLRILDLRDRKKCTKARLPGAECTPIKDLGKLGLPYAAGQRDLVLVPSVKLDKVPSPALKYKGKVFVLQGGFDGWRRYALTKPEPPATDATAETKEAYRFRSALHAAMTGAKPPPPPAPTGKFVPKPRKKKGGGCG